MVTTCLAMTAVLNEQGAEADVTAGLSLGEYCAIAEAGAMDLLDAIRLVRVRGQLMQHTVPTGEGAMAAVLGMDADQIDAVIEPIVNVTVANYNCPGQIVITGGTAGIEHIERGWCKAGSFTECQWTVSFTDASECRGKAWQRAVDSTAW